MVIRVDEKVLLPGADRYGLSRAYQLRCFQKSEQVLGSCSKSAEEPRFRRSPIALDGVGRDGKHLSSLFHTQATEESKFNYPDLSGVDPGKRLQSLIQSH